MTKKIKLISCYILEIVRLINSCYVLETVELIPEYLFFKSAPLTLGLDNSSCESDEYTDFDVFRTPPNNARDTMHCTSCWAFIYRLRSL